MGHTGNKEHHLDGSFRNKVAERYLKCVFAKCLLLLAFQRADMHPAQRLMWLTFDFVLGASLCLDFTILMACILDPQNIELALSGYGPKIRKVQPQIHRKQRSVRVAQAN